MVDASNKGLQSLTLYGKSTQDGTPTPEVPVEIVSVENPIVTISGDNSEQSLSLPYTLRGIPVTTGGNYTDEAGQQWICDTVELNGDGTGKLVQRIMCKIFDGTETLRNNWFPIMVYEIESPNFYANVDSDVTCNYFNHTYIGNVHGTTLAVGSLDKLGFTNVSEVQSLMLDSYNNGNPIVLQYALVTPIETELTAEEVAAFMALHTNKSNTTIFNSTGTNQTVEYTADTKLYIDNKIAELVAVQ